MSDDDFSYIHAVDGSSATSAHLYLYLLVSWNKVVITAPHQVVVSLTSKDEVIRCRDVIREHVRADRADRVNLSGRLTLNLGRRASRNTSICSTSRVYITPRVPSRSTS